MKTWTLKISVHVAGGGIEIFESNLLASNANHARSRFWETNLRSEIYEVRHIQMDKVNSITIISVTEKK